MHAVDVMAGTITGTLPGGYFDDEGSLHTDVAVAPLSGRDEELLYDSLSAGPALVTALLGRCTWFTSGAGSITEDVARRMLVADRRYLLMKLREATVGPLVQATILCPGAECGARIDIDFQIGDVPIVPSVSKGPAYTMEVSQAPALHAAEGEAGTAITFRLPNGADQEVIAPVLARSEEEAAELLLARCIISMGPERDPGVAGVRRLPPRARAELEDQMETLAPGIDLVMEGTCPECRAEFSFPFDMEHFFLRELGGDRGALYLEVHYLAFHYHWSEREIMEMPRAKRQHYIAVLSGEIERQNDAVLQ